MNANNIDTDIGIGIYPLMPLAMATVPLKLSQILEFVTLCGP